MHKYIETLKNGQATAENYGFNNALAATVFFMKFIGEVLKINKANIKIWKHPASLISSTNSDEGASLESCCLFMSLLSNTHPDNIY